MTGKMPPPEPHRFVPRWRIGVYTRKGRGKQYVFRKVGDAWTQRTVRSARMLDPQEVVPVTETLTKFALPRSAWLTETLAEVGMGAGLDPAGAVPSGGDAGPVPTRQGIDVTPDMYIHDYSDNSWYRVDAAYPTMDGKVILRAIERGTSRSDFERPGQ